MKSLRHAKHLLRPVPGAQQVFSNHRALWEWGTVIIFIGTFTAPLTTSQVGWGLGLLGASPDLAASGGLCQRTFSAPWQEGWERQPRVQVPPPCPPQLLLSAPGLFPAARCLRPAPGVGGESEPGPAHMVALRA